MNISKFDNFLNESLKKEFKKLLNNITSYFNSEDDMEKMTMRLINGAITEVLDPKIYYSRFSFLESGKEAIDLKITVDTYRP
jgi:hypothetical protein